MYEWRVKRKLLLSCQNYLIVIDHVVKILTRWSSLGLVRIIECVHLVEDPECVVVVRMELNDQQLALSS